MESRTRRFVVEPDQDGLRLDQFLAGLLPDHSRSQIQRFIKDGLVHGPSAGKAGTVVRAGWPALVVACLIDATWLNGKPDAFGHIMSGQIRADNRRVPVTCIACIAYCRDL